MCVCVCVCVCGCVGVCMYVCERERAFGRGISDIPVYKVGAYISPCLSESERDFPGSGGYFDV